MQAAALVENIIDTMELDAEEIVDIGNVSSTLREWMDHHREMTQLTRPFLNAHAQLDDNDEIRHLLGDDSRDALKELLDPTQHRRRCSGLHTRGRGRNLYEHEKEQ